MKLGTVDQESRIRINGAKPSEKFWVIEEKYGYRLERVPEPENRLSKEEVIRKIKASSLRFSGWEKLREDTREP